MNFVNDENTQGNRYAPSSAWGSRGDFTKGAQDHCSPVL